MDRREFLLLHTSALCLSVVGIANAQNQTLGTSDTASFGSPLFADDLGNAVWSLSAKLVVFGRYRDTSVPVLVEISTDRDFQQIVHSAVVKVDRDSRFQVSYLFRNELVNSALYARLSISDDSTAVGYPPKRLYSQTAALSPWK